MKALSIRQPWAWLIVMGIPIFESADNPDGSTRVVWNNKVVLKDVENRNWPIPREFKLPRRIAIHASKHVDHQAQSWLMESGFAPMSVLLLYSDMVPRGVIMGEVDLVACVTESKSPWFTGPYGFVLENPEAYERPIPCRGKPGFFEIPYVPWEERSQE